MQGGESDLLETSRPSPRPGSSPLPQPPFPKPRLNARSRLLPPGSPFISCGAGLRGAVATCRGGGGSRSGAPPTSNSGLPPSAPAPGPQAPAPSALLASRGTQRSPHCGPHSLPSPWPQGDCWNFFQTRPRPSRSQSLSEALLVASQRLAFGTLAHQPLPDLWPRGQLLPLLHRVSDESPKIAGHAGGLPGSSVSCRWEGLPFPCVGQTHLYPSRPIPKVASPGEPSIGTQALPRRPEPPAPNLGGQEGTPRPARSSAARGRGSDVPSCLSPSRRSCPPAAPGTARGPPSHFLTVGGVTAVCQAPHSALQFVWALLSTALTLKKSRLYEIPPFTESQLSPRGSAEERRTQLGPTPGLSLPLPGPCGRTVFAVCPLPPVACDFASERAGLPFLGRLGRKGGRGVRTAGRPVFRGVTGSEKGPWGAGQRELGPGRQWGREGWPCEGTGRGGKP